ncbi:MAG TPA: nucleotidyl transferase AbiEii/AbiGii toxin family protein [Candidatus Wirthbacteria bacterium]|nr:nucleotidyl transferase AbiEii/AbiGii toxin family protein [Candidatus Wirthbacteria bacterium]
MFDMIRALIEDKPAIQNKINLLREYLQTVILYRLSHNKQAKNLYFGGGTALRFFYNLPRFSEDLDFEYALASETLSLGDLLENVAQYFIRQNLDTTFSFQEKPPVLRGNIKFPGLLYQLGLANEPNRAFLIKLEVDVSPPCLTNTETFTIAKFNYTFPLRKRSLEAMMAGKLAAIIRRPYTKGRDYYDLVWYLLRGIHPDLQVLADLTGIDSLPRLYQDLENNLRQVDSRLIAKDVAPFLERPEEADNLHRLPEIFEQYKQVLQLAKPASRHSDEDQHPR